MADILTQLQDEVGEFANQMVASMYYVSKHHEQKKLSPTDNVRQDNNKGEDGAPPVLDGFEVDPYPADVFKAGLLELAQDLVTKEQQIEYLVSMLPGLENSEKDQENKIKQLEEEMKIAHRESEEVAKDIQAVGVRLDSVIRGVKRP